MEETLQRCRKILEVSPSATREEIQQTYNQLRKIHGKDAGISVALGMDEFAPESRAQILDEIEAAYAELSACLDGPPQAQTAPFLPPPQAFPPSPAAEPSGPATMSSLRKARIAAGLTLEQVAEETCVRMDYLKALEEECFEHLPLATVNVRGYLTAFVQMVGLPMDAIVTVYMKRYMDWQALRK